MCLEGNWEAGIYHCYPIIGSDPAKTYITVSPGVLPMDINVKKKKITYKITLGII